ncbi:hypothetical protein GWI33_002765 [Rhynchophorus ferrugineus]|uniref:Uncharacterized protein n=1 Tax=Rhynchophorus ferrugineus TaxID=354439 RepID=A0A834HKE0_RHYFE|nr:hypothetical protein GWI33_002765 [Rhynchophorus ferrugineus]
MHNTDSGGNLSQKTIAAAANAIWLSGFVLIRETKERGKVLRSEKRSAKGGTASFVDGARFLPVAKGLSARGLNPE